MSYCIRQCGGLTRSAAPQPFSRQRCIGQVRIDFGQLETSRWRIRVHRVNASSTSYSRTQAQSRISRKNRSRHYGVDFIRLSHKTLSLVALTGLEPLGVAAKVRVDAPTDCQTALLRRCAANWRNAASCYATVLAITDQTPATQRTYCPKVAASSRIPTSPECRCRAVMVSAGAPVCRSVSQV